jgi:hypothetical protein
MEEQVGDDIDEFVHITPVDKFDQFKQLDAVER